MAAGETGAPSAGTGPPVDEILVEGVLKGERESFDQLYARYFPRVFRFVDRRMSNRADAEETVQEVFFSLFASLESFRGEAPFAAWVFGVARRTIAARFKRKRRDTVPLGDEEPDNMSALGGFAPRAPDPLESYEASERLHRLEQAIRHDLTDDQWRLFRLHHLENHSIQEIATATDRSEDSVKSHLYRARRLLLAR
jgi:RNA polymerase sigma-70 factor (ECF subfamily)